VLYGAQQPRRRDAQRNRSAIVRAASDMMTSRGPAVPMPEIARRAGVGQATVYRHFPDRDALTAAVVAHHLERLEASAKAGADRPATFRDLLREALHTQLDMLPLVALVRRLAPGRRERFQRRMIAALSAPLRLAQRDGHVRADLAPGDLVLLFAMVLGVAEATDDTAAARAAADRSIDLLLDGVFR
jgi:AcrR family transcriptional regulator